MDSAHWFVTAFPVNIRGQYSIRKDNIIYAREILQRQCHAATVHTVGRGTDSGSTFRLSLQAEALIVLKIIMCHRVQLYLQRSSNDKHCTDT